MRPLCDSATPTVTVTVHNWGVTASCSCGWSHTVHTDAAEGAAHIMALVEAHLGAHRRQL